jgi:hypothetical protein
LILELQRAARAAVPSAQPSHLDIDDVLMDHLGTGVVLLNVATPVLDEPVSVL